MKKLLLTLPLVFALHIGKAQQCDSLRRELFHFLLLLHHFPMEGWEEEVYKVEFVHEYKVLYIDKFGTLPEED